MGSQGARADQLKGWVDCLGCENYSQADIAAFLAAGDAFCQQHGGIGEQVELTIGGGKVQATQLGKGCSGRVVYGRSRVNPYAIKLFKSQFLKPVEHLLLDELKINYELRAYAGAICPRLLGICWDGDTCALVYECRNQASLEVVLSFGKLLRSPADVVLLLRELAYKLMTLSKAGYTHRDLKLDNIFMHHCDRQTFPCIGDVGLMHKHGTPLHPDIWASGNSMAKTAEEMVERVLAPTSDMVGFAYIMFAVLIHKGQSFLKPYRAMRVVVLKAIMADRPLADLLSRQAQQELGFDPADSTHTLVFWVCLLAMALCWGQGAENRPSWEYIFMVLHDLNELVAVEGNKAMQHLPQVARRRLIKLYEVVWHQYKAELQLTNFEVLAQPILQDDRAPLLPLLSIAEFRAAVEGPVLVPIKSHLLGVHHIGCFNDMLAPVQSYQQLLRFLERGMTPEELDDEVIRAVGGNLQQVISADSSYPEDLAKDALGELGSAAEEAWGGYHHARTWDNNAHIMAEHIHHLQENTLRPSSSLLASRRQLSGAEFSREEVELHPVSVTLAGVNAVLDSEVVTRLVKLSLGAAVVAGSEDERQAGMRRLVAGLATAHRTKFTLELVVKDSGVVPGLKEASKLWVLDSKLMAETVKGQLSSALASEWLDPPRCGSLLEAVLSLSLQLAIGDGAEEVERAMAPFLRVPATARGPPPGFGPIPAGAAAAAAPEPIQPVASLAGQQDPQSASAPAALTAAAGLFQQPVWVEKQCAQHQRLGFGAAAYGLVLAAGDGQTAVVLAAEPAPPPALPPSAWLAARAGAGPQDKTMPDVQQGGADDEGIMLPWPGELLDGDLLAAQPGRPFSPTNRGSPVQGGGQRQGQDLESPTKEQPAPQQQPRPRGPWQLPLPAKQQTSTDAAVTTPRRGTRERQSTWKILSAILEEGQGQQMMEDGQASPCRMRTVGHRTPSSGQKRSAGLSGRMGALALDDGSVQRPATTPKRRRLPLFEMLAMGHTASPASEAVAVAPAHSNPTQQQQQQVLSTGWTPAARWSPPRPAGDAGAAEPQQAQRAVAQARDWGGGGLEGPGQAVGNGGAVVRRSGRAAPRSSLSLTGGDLMLALCNNQPVVFWSELGPSPVDSQPRALFGGGGGQYGQLVSFMLGFPSALPQEIAREYCTKPFRTCLDAWNQRAQDIVYGRLVSPHHPLAEHFCAHFGIAPAAFHGLLELLVKKDSLPKLLEISLSGCLADSQLGEGLGSVRKTVVEGKVKMPWCYVCAPFCKWQEVEQKIYRRALLQYIKQHGSESPTPYGVLAPGEGVARLRINPEFTGALGLGANGRADWFEIKL